jgi:hypothetical protein
MHSVVVASDLSKVIFFVTTTSLAFSTVNPEILCYVIPFFLDEYKTN